MIRSCCSNPALSRYFPLKFVGGTVEVFLSCFSYLLGVFSDAELLLVLVHRF